jgi:hypothetical protein
LPIAMHFSWNVLLGPVLGLAVSGNTQLKSGWRLLTVQGHLGVSDPLSQGWVQTGAALFDHREMKPGGVGYRLQMGGGFFGR